MLFSIAIGGAVGSLARYALGGLAQRFSAAFPYGTLTVNLLGSFALGFLVRYLVSTTASTELRAGLTIGLCGGFTTFSTFSYETAMLLSAGNYVRAGVYTLASVAGCIVATFVGFAAARAMLIPPR